MGLKLDATLRLCELVQTFRKGTAAFAGRERLIAAYQDAIERGYRFYSFGDAMLIE